MAKAEAPRMANLPTERITPSRPFTRTGLDFAGPLLIKSPMSKATQKAYIFIFVCFSTKAIHIELVSALTTSALLVLSDLCLDEVFLVLSTQTTVLTSLVPATN